MPLIQQETDSANRGERSIVNFQFVINYKSIFK